MDKRLKGEATWVDHEIETAGVTDQKVENANNEKWMKLRRKKRSVLEMHPQTKEVNQTEQYKHEKFSVSENAHTLTDHRSDPKCMEKLKVLEPLWTSKVTQVPGATDCARTLTSY